MTTAAIPGSSGRPATGQHLLDGYVPDPCAIPPLCDEGEFAAMAQSLVADEAPRLFAIMQVYGDRVDGRIAAWGMAFADHTEVVSATSGAWMSLQAPETAVRAFTVGSHISARIVWVDPVAATPTGGRRDNLSGPVRRLPFIGARNAWQVDVGRASTCHADKRDGQ